MTDIVGQTTGGVKQTTRDPKVLPEVIVYDVELTSTLPASSLGRLRRKRDGARDRGTVRREQQSAHRVDR
jgi:hypothetical protein